MGLNGKVVSQSTVKFDGNAFFDLIRYRIHELSKISPQKVVSVDLLEGEWGAVGSVMSWTFIHDGKKVTSKEKVDSIDEGKRTITYSVIGGDLLQLYKTMKFGITADIHGEETVVTLTLEYEKQAEAIPDPHMLMDLCVSLVKDVERHLNLVPN